MKRLLLGLVLALTAWGQGRLRAPADVACSRDELTSYTGRITAYSRTGTHLSLTLRTDADTTEKFSVKLPAKMRIAGEPFGPQDWKFVETSKGKLKPDVRATVWECKGGDRQIDWQPPRE